MTFQSARRNRRSGEVRRGEDDPAYSHAVMLWECGDYELCLRTLDESYGSEGQTHLRYLPAAILLRARALIRTGRIDDARDWLLINALQFQESRGDANATYAMLVGAVHAASRAFDQAEAWFSRAVRCEPHRGIISEINYCRALALYQQGQFRAARDEIERALPSAPDILGARTRALRGWVSTAESQLAAAHRDFAAALQIMRTSSARDTHLRVSTLYALAITAAELNLGDLEVLEAEVAAVTWTTNLAGEQTQILRHLGLAYLHAGDRDRAIARFIASTEVAPGTPWSIFGFVEMATMSLARGEEVGPLSLARKAASLADRHSWGDITGEMRLSLLTIAQLFARLHHGARADEYRELYYEHVGVSTMSALKHDTRLATFEQHVEGSVLAALGERDRAIGLIEAALSEWVRIGFKFRADEAREDLSRLRAGQTEQLGNVVRPRLSVRDEQMLTFILDGKTDAEIAEHFHIAKNTVKNNVLQIYAKFGVHKRAQLVVAARRMAAGRQA